ncbi:MAG: RNA polymerase factor sigma-54 [Rhizobiaceae bacterium]
MALAAKLALKQSQSLVMTPQLMQSIRLLQMTHVELQHFVDEEMERNPLLEPVADPPDFSEAPDDNDAADFSSPQDHEAGDWMRPDIASAAELQANFDAPVDNLFPDDTPQVSELSPDLASQWKATTAGAGNSSDDFDFADVLASPVTLRDHVAEQISFGFADMGERAFATELADGLDESGYLRMDVQDAAARLGMPQDQAMEVLETLQTFDPPGLFARDLAECLAIQLKAKDRHDPAMQAMIGHLDLLAKRDFAQLKRICGVDEADLLDMLAEIRLLEPKPGAGFAGGTAETIIPDVSVRAAPDGSWAIELNSAALPRVLVNQTYYAKVSRSAQNTQDKEFLSECLQTANWLARSLDQRARTILKVAYEIVKQQDAFLIHGVSKLRPLNLKTVADAIKMHESTVSRVTANKYMETPRGIFELRFFFTAAIADVDGGESHSAEAVRHDIRLMIDAESAKNVLSDDQIVIQLAGKGIEIARRTVAKYRESLNIASSVQRRREKRAIANTKA